MKNCFSTLYTGVTVAQNMICIALWTRLDRGLLCKKQRDKFKVENISLLYFPVNGGKGGGTIFITGWKNGKFTLQSVHKVE